jgi:hypothetical protein
MANRGEPQAQAHAPHKVEALHKLDASLKNLQIPHTAVLPSPDSDMMRKMTSSLSTVEQHWNSVTEVMKGVFNNKGMSMQDCLKLQVIMQKYTMELDLTGKVVEKATNGLKDTLKTQV